MLSNKVKIIRIISRPPKSDHSPYSCIELQLKYSPTSSGIAYMRRDKYKAFLLERKIFKHGVPFRLLEEYGELISEITSFDDAQNNE